MKSWYVLTERPPSCDSGGERPSLSLVVPMYDEEANVRPLVASIQTALAELPDWELLLVDDGSRDRTVEVALDIARDEPRLRVLQLARNFGQTQAMQAGFDHARAERVVTLDGDLQNDPLDIPRLLAKLDEGFDLVTGYRVRRRDRLFRRKIPSFLANRLIARLTRVRVRDNGCSLKAYRRALLRRMHLYSDMHRFLPALAYATVGARIAEIPVRHHARRAGVSKYGLSRILKLLADLLTLKMISSFREHPIRFFGTGALIAVVLAAITTLVSVFSLRSGEIALTDAYVLPAMVLLWLMLSTYLLLLGLVGEVALRASRTIESGEGAAWEEVHT